MIGRKIPALKSECEFKLNYSMLHSFNTYLYCLFTYYAFSPRNKSLRSCLVNQAKEALSCHGNANPTVGEESCVFSSIAAFENPKNSKAGVPGLPPDIGREPEVADMACSGAFPVTCNTSAPFRTISGICNNPANVLWGAASTKLRRFVRNMYSDKTDLPRGAGKGRCQKKRNRARNVRRCAGNKDAILPDAAEISRGISKLMGRRRRKKKTEIGVTSLFVYFAMFLHYDMSLVPEMMQDGKESCCKNKELSGCFAIRKGCHPKSRSGCIEFRRSLAFCGGEKGQKREQLNAETAFIDLSNLYGSSAKVSEGLRLMKDGLLKTSNGGRNLPVRDRRSLAGDPRVTFAPGLTAVHALFLREHNRIAAELAKLCCKGNDELLFQRARRIVVAEMQNIAFQAYLPLLLGRKEQNHCGLNVSETTAFDPARKPNIRNAFSAAASRYGQVLLNPKVDWESYVGKKKLGKLKTLLFDERIHRLGNGSGVDFLINAMMQQRTKKYAHLPTGKDLMALTIQRGRDHGLPPYNHFRKYCKLPMICTWRRRPSEIDPDSWDMLSILYSHPSDIDLYVGGILEAPITSGLVGKTFTCLLSEQFLNIMHGDRFFFTHRGPLISYPFDDDQLKNIKRRRISDLICDNTMLAQVYKNPFLIKSDKIVCGQHSKLNLTLFSDKYDKNKRNSTASSLAFSLYLITPDRGNSHILFNLTPTLI